MGKMNNRNPSVVNSSDKAEKKANPFEIRSNHKSRHPALNRRIKGGNRNVGRARTIAQEKREKDLLTKLHERKSASEVVDKRFDKKHGGEQLSQEERMLQRLQRVREKKRKRTDRFQLGDDDDDQGPESGDDDGLTHQGRSLSEVLDEEAVLEDSEDDEDVNALIERLKSGETFNAVATQPKKQMTKREAMLDVIRKSKILKMERQREKAEDDEERDRVDALMRNVVTTGQLAFQPTGKEKELERIAAARTEADDYERAVRELQMDRGPRAVATERIKTSEELAAEAVKELERLEAERLGRLEEMEEEETAGSTSDQRVRKRMRPPPDHQLTEKGDDANLPFILECPKSHAEFLELLAAHPSADLDTVITRIRKTTSIHLQAENRPRLGRFAAILVEHVHLLGERVGQLGEADRSFLGASPSRLGALLIHIYGLATDVPREVAGAIATQLESLRRALDNELGKVASTVRSGGDLGCDLKSSAEVKRGAGGHKDGLAESLDAEAHRLSKLRADKDTFTSPVRCWPSPGYLAVISCAAKLYSVSDQRHPIVSSAALLLARALIECPVRGPGDVCAALATAQILTELIRRKDVGAHRFSPEAFLFLRVTVGQLAVEERAHQQFDQSKVVSMVTLDVKQPLAHDAFHFARGAVNAMEDKIKAQPTGLMGCFSYDRDPDWLHRMANAFVSQVRSLLFECAEGVSDVASADVLLADIAAHVGKIKAFSALVPVLQTKTNACQSIRKPLRLQEFTPEDKTLAPRFLVDSETAARPGDEFKGLKRQVKRERKGVARELRLDGQFVAGVRAKAKFDALQQARSERQKNFASLENQQAAFSRALKEGIALKGAGIGGLSLKGRRMGKKQLD